MLGLCFSGGLAEMEATMLTPGIRTVFTNLTVCTIGCYQSTLPDRSERTKWRYTFKDDAGQRYVYTGRHYNLTENAVITLTATVKRLEPEYRQIRLARLDILHRERQYQLL